jgi:hypothetical protein
MPQWWDWLMPLIGNLANVLTLLQFAIGLLSPCKAKPRSERISKERRIEIDEPDGRRIRIVEKTRINRE